MSQKILIIEDEKELADKMLDLIENPPAIAKLDGIAKKLEMQYKKENCAELYILRFRSYIWQHHDVQGLNQYNFIWFKSFCSCDIYSLRPKYACNYCWIKARQRRTHSIEPDKRKRIFFISWAIFRKFAFCWNKLQWKD